MRDDNSLYWIWLAEKCGIASKEFPRLISHFEDPFEIYRLEPEEIEAINCIGNRLKSALCDRSLERAYSIIKYCKKHGIDIISYADTRYPSNLRTLEDPPIVLYCLGKLPKTENRICIGVVGTRKISAYGMESAYKISYELAASNVCIVSGMALGVDAVAACGALDAKGDTIAVLGCGIDVVYPKEHTKLQRIISNRGAVITELPPMEPPYGKNFPKRNRIISGLSNGVLVIEGNQISGALITARYAATQGRDIFALPGKINENNSEGSNLLIKGGANVVLSAEDILYFYDFLYTRAINYRGLKHAKSSSDFSPEAVERYGVSSKVYFSSSEAVRTEDNAQGALKEKKSSTAPKDREKPVWQSDNREAEIGEDMSAKILEGLDPLTKRIFDMMPMDRAVLPDEFTEEGIGIAETVTAFTMLEISGLVSALPGGAYIRK